MTQKSHAGSPFPATGRARALLVHGLAARAHHQFEEMSR